MKLDNKVYDILKWATQLAIPALGTLYFALAGIWGFPYAEQVLGTLTALTTFLGVILGVSAANYAKKTEGTLEVDTSGEVSLIRFNLDTDVNELTKLDSVTFKVDKDTKIPLDD